LLLSSSCAFLAVLRTGPPAAVPSDAPPAEFSSGRAMRHLRRIAGEPRAQGTPGHAQARVYILQELAQLGLDTQVQETPLAGNIMARLPGAGRTGRALLLVCHYDTVAGSPGAGDDGSSVAVLLETLRALKSGAQPANDVIALFTDGEERGLVGARAFVYGHPWAKDVALVLNFEARGTAGASLMFETSAENGQLVRHFASAAPRPVAYSLSRELYELLPNNTDLSVFKDAGLPGLNFAFIENGATHYHSPLDNLENLDERSVQHQGTYALSLARRFGGIGLGDLRERDAIYFDLLGFALARYSTVWVLPLVALAATLALAVVLAGRRAKLMNLKAVGKGLAAVPAGVLVAAFGVVLTERVAVALGGERFAAPVLAFVALGAAVAVHAWFCQRVGGANLLLGGLTWWLLLLLLTSLLWPGASYLFAWPLLPALVAALIWFVAAGARSQATARLALLLVAALVGIALFAPVAYLALVAFGLNSGGAAFILAAPASLVLALLAPYFAPSERTAHAREVRVAAASSSS
jgi:hypothetical protein